MTATIDTTIEATALAHLQNEGRLLNPVLKAATHRAGRFGFRGELALRFASKLADEARPPELKCDQVMAVATAGVGSEFASSCARARRWPLISGSPSLCLYSRLTSSLVIF